MGTTCGSMLNAQVSGRTALIWAGYTGHADCARLLLNAGADKNAKNEVRANRSAASAVGRACGFEFVGFLCASSKRRFLFSKLKRLA